MTTRPLFLAAIVSSTVLIGLTGCGKSASKSASEAAVSAATGGKVQVSQSGDTSQMTIKAADGTVANINSGKNVALPRNFPSDVHLPASYTIKTAMTVGPEMVLEMHTAAAAEAVYSEYDSTMKAGGWTEAMAIQSADKGSVLTFQKDKSSVIVSIMAGSVGTDVHLQITSGQR